MPEQSPLAQPAAWSAVADAYTQDFLPLFALYAQDAIALAELPHRPRVLDVAAGPGTISLLVAEQAEQVVAVDFAEEMVARLKQRVQEAGLDQVEARVGDGQVLPFEDASFDGAFSMFGLMFFPDRHAGFSELRRVLKPGRRAVVSSWTPASEAPLLAALFECLSTHFPQLSFGRAAPPLSDADEFQQEMLQAGFSAVQVHTVAHRLEVPSVREFWEIQERASAPIVLLRQSVSDEEWRHIAAKVLEQLEIRFGSSQLSFAWPAHLGVGVK